MALVSPPPTYAEVILVDAQGKRPRFNPIWLKWFIDLAGTINAAGGTTILHNDTGSIQGGSASERYHLTSVQHGVTTAADWAVLIALGAGILAKTAAASAIAGQSAAILADVANDRAEMNWIAGDVTNQPM